VGSSKAEDAVKRFLDTWVSGDIDASLRYIADDAVYALYISCEALPFAGETVGRASIEAALRQMRSQWDYLVFRPHNFVTKGETVRFRVEHMYRHRPSGAVLSGNFRMVVKVRDGLLVRVDEYHDRAMVEAFMRLHGGG
jgi:ketosteroid isomerase-like protein